MYSPVSVENFGGLNLVDDPGTVGWSGAIDLQNVDLRHPGTVRSRIGMNTFGTARAWTYIHRHTTFAGADVVISVYSNAGTNVYQDLDSANLANINASYSPGGGDGYVSMVNFGTATASRVYVAVLSNTLLKYDAGTWGTATEPAAGHPTHLAVTPSDNRLVAAGFSSDPYRVHFSDAGAPETWGANNYVDLEPGDGQPITGLVSHGNSVYVFKPHKIYEFYGTSTDSSGNPIFNWRRVSGSLGARGAADGSGKTMHSVVSTPQGIYFVADTGIYLLSGGAQRISDPIAPLFSDYGAPQFATNLDSTYYAGGTDPVALSFANDYLILGTGNISGSYPTTLVYDTRTNNWLKWNVGAKTSLAYAIELPSANRGEPAIVFAPTRQSAYGVTSLGKMDPIYTDDAGSAITSLYRSGFSTFGSPDPKAIREWKLTGIGSPTFKTATDFGSLSTGNTVTLGTSPAIAEGRDRTAVQGRQIGWQVSGTSAWTLNSLTAHTREKRSPGTDD